MTRPALIMIVDDDPAVLVSLSCSFELQGYRVAGFASAEAALASPALAETSCLVTDLRLPGADGLDLVAQVRRRRLRMPAVLITTPSASVRRKAVTAGVELVEKPLLDDELSVAVRRSLAA